MERNLKDNIGGFNRFVGKFTAEKKKAVFALSLIVLMIFMWVKALSGKGPVSSEAAFFTQELAEEKSESQLKISFIELPKIQGRNDVLSRDFFTVKNWHRFLRGQDSTGLAGVEEVNVILKGGGEEGIRRVAERLNLKAIVLNEEPQAFINDKLLIVGGKLFVTDGDDTYECEVVEIEASSVIVRCGQAEIQLKLAQIFEEAK